MEMKSKTKYNLTEEKLKELVQHHFSIDLKKSTPLTEGYFNASYLLLLENGEEMVLKVAPPKDVPVLTYEKEIMATEVLFYRLTKEQTDLPVPEVLVYEADPRLIDSPYYFMTKLEGRTLHTIPDLTPEKRRPLYEKMARDLACLHGIGGDTFGYITMKEQCAGLSAHAALSLSFENLLDDCRAVKEPLPIEEKELRKVFSKGAEAFTDITSPCMVHFDLWDGNIFVEEEEEELSLRGYIDFERGFFADPAADLYHVSANLDLKKNSWFLDIYNRHAKKAVVYDRSMEIRIQCYKLYLFVLMYVECFYRDVEGSFEGQKRWVSGEIPETVSRLNGMTG